MALTGTLTADFASFFDACAKAEVSLKGFEASTGKVTTALDRMVDNFSGRKVISEATLMAEAVQRVGGVSKFTEDELAKIGATAQEAANKLKAWGQDVPKNIQDLATHAKTATSAFESMTGTLERVGAAFGIAFSIERAVEFVKAALDQAKALEILSLNTQIGTDDLQILAGATREYGIDADTLGRALFQLSRRIAGGDGSVATGLHSIGLSFDDVKDKHGMELFIEIEHGLATLQGSLRDTTAAELFGSRLGSAMGSVATSIDETIDESKRLNTLMSKESVHAAAEYSREIERVEKNLSSMVVNLIGPVATGLNQYIDTVQKAGFWTATWARIQDDFAAGFGKNTHENFDALAASLGVVKAKTDEFTAANIRMMDSHTAVAAVVTVQTQAERFMAALEADASVELDAAQRKNLDHLKQIGELTAQNAAAIGINSVQFEKYKAGLEAAKKAATDLAAAHKEHDAIVMLAYTAQIAQLVAMEAQRAKSYGTSEQIAMLGRLDVAEQGLAKTVYAQIESEKERMKIIEQAGTRHAAITLQRMALEEKLMASTNTAVIAELDAHVQLNAAYGLDAQGHIKVASAAETLRLGLEALHLTKQAGISQTAQEQVLLNQYIETLRVQAIAQGVSNVELGKVPALAAATSAAINGVTKSYWAAVDAAAALAGIPSIGHRVGEPGSEIHAGASPNLSTFNTGAGAQGGFSLGGFKLAGFASGGPVLQDGPIYAHAGEFVLPKGGGGGGTVINHFYVNGTAEEVAREIADTVLRTVMQSKKLGTA